VLPHERSRLYHLHLDGLRHQKVVDSIEILRVEEADFDLASAIGGLKVTTRAAWFAARPSGTEDVYKIYAESFKGPDHLAQVQAEAKDVVDAALA